MKYILFLFFISMAFAFDASAAADIVNKNCNPEAVSCQRDVQRKFMSGPVKSAEREAAMAQCNVAFEECRAANGGLLQSNGRIAQMYNPANPRFIYCRENSGVTDPTADAFRDCMKGGNVKKAPPKPKVEEPVAEIVVVGVRPRCSKEFPDKCTTAASCIMNMGSWVNNACKQVDCPAGTTADPNNSIKCKCDNEVAATIDRGNAVQRCPVQCASSEHKRYDLSARTCQCEAGFEMKNGNCVAATGAPPAVTACLNELREKAVSCNGAASTAVTKCDANRESSGDDTLGTLQNLLGGVNSAVQAKNSGSGAMDNCMNAGIASTSGYHALDALRGKCDDEISTCKTSCTDATTFINANKDKAYQACRKKVYDAEVCLAASVWEISSEEAFNAHWDRVNKAGFESEVQQLLTNVADNKSKCETGPAVTNRDQISNFMSDMNSSVKSAAQCQCQLGSGSSGQDCSKQNGPAECALNPALPGCAKLTGNCLDTNDTSAKCVCFRNPGSDECKASQLAAAKMNPTEVSGFAGGGSTAAGSTLGGDSSSGKTETGGDIAGDLSGLNADGDFASGVSGSATTDAGSPFGAAAGGGASGGGSGGGGASADGATAAGGGGDDEGTGKKLGGLFDVAKSALGNLFKGKAGDKGSFDGVNKNGSNFSDGNGLDSKKWRPRGMVRGLAGDTELAGKFEDIWKVMNKQYKVQDQKDTFIFGGETK